MFKLRKIKEEDLELVMRWRMSEEVTKYMYTDPQLTLEGQKIWLSHIKSNWERMKYWIIEVENKSVGVLSINDIDSINEKASWAYYLGDTSMRGKGLGKILECNIYDYVFYHLNLNKLCCEVFEFNEKVIKIHERFGAKIEGKLYEHIKKNGQFHNVVTMGILKREWEIKKKDFEYERLQIEL